MHEAARRCRFRLPRIWPGVVADLIGRRARINVRDDAAKTDPAARARAYYTFGSREVAVEQAAGRTSMPDTVAADAPLRVAEEHDRTEVAGLLRGREGADIKTQRDRAAGVVVEVTASLVLHSFGAIGQSGCQERKLLSRFRDALHVTCEHGEGVVGRSVLSAGGGASPDQP